MAKAKTLGTNLPVPQDRDEAAATITTIGELQRELTRIEADMNDRLAAIKETWGINQADDKAKITLMKRLGSRIRAKGEC
ncbi:MAG: hypothetical protein KIS86_04620 [Devosia sp.]|nr:hypothetical protein [Devosia sp.]